MPGKLENYVVTKYALTLKIGETKNYCNRDLSTIFLHINCKIGGNKNFAKIIAIESKIKNGLDERIINKK